jgi:hypothetical protein
MFADTALHDAGKKAVLDFITNPSREPDSCAASASA